MRLFGALLLAVIFFFAREVRAGEKPPLDLQVPANLKTAAFGLG